MKAKVVNSMPNTFSPRTLVVTKSGTRIVMCIKEINELSFNGIILFDELNPFCIGACDTLAKSAYSLFTGEITLSN